MAEENRIVSASRRIKAPAATIFELIADPAKQPVWDGNDNLAEADGGQRVTAEGQSFRMNLTKGAVRENRVVEFVEGRRIAWMPGEVGGAPFGQLWRWQIEPQDDGSSLVTQTYDWSKLHDEKREARARATTSEKLLASIDRLAELAERSA